MTEDEIRDEIKRGITLVRESTWTTADFINSMVQLIKLESSQEKFERYIWHVMEMRRLEDILSDGDKSIIGKMKGYQALVDKLSREHLKRMGVTDLEKFMKRYLQGKLI